jgi:hypothetical protein
MHIKTLSCSMFYITEYMATDEISNATCQWEEISHVKGQWDEISHV